MYGAKRASPVASVKLFMVRQAVLEASPELSKHSITDLRLRVSAQIKLCQQYWILYVLHCLQIGTYLDAE